MSESDTVPWVAHLNSPVVASAKIATCDIIRRFVKQHWDFKQDFDSLRMSISPAMVGLCVVMSAEGAALYLLQHVAECCGFKEDESALPSRTRCLIATRWATTFCG